MSNYGKGFRDAVHGGPKRVPHDLLERVLCGQRTNARYGRENEDYCNGHGDGKRERERRHRNQRNRNW